MAKKYTITVKSGKRIADTIHTFAPAMDLEIEHTDDKDVHLIHGDDLNVVVSFCNFLTFESIVPEDFMPDEERALKEMWSLTVGEAND